MKLYYILKVLATTFSEESREWRGKYYTHNSGIAIHCQKDKKRYICYFKKITHTQNFVWIKWCQTIFFSTSIGTSKLHVIYYSKDCSPYFPLDRIVLYIEYICTLYTIQCRMSKTIRLDLCDIKFYEVLIYEAVICGS